VDGTGSESCPMVCFGISSAEPSGSTTRELVRWYDGSQGNKL